ncbi:DegT/DnrJ/EryC1/StrS family aminotransferase [Streptomyces sp. SPB074]|uniref:DegT/DnrJ/EryC1/StrS family aminotransferase n=1 Tax=Streptomyces sp. (strain SPB074) TaxID=465543 RepID=UPI00017F23AA|nr:DegT/DnrJ/EryC1/StrS family aminotransferase [Streptomyces sp. SPB074]EDY42092.1 DegT/DnrJ/EryC1/StrS family aminotransferase [Streptomyces sp. SPB074]
MRRLRLLGVEESQGERAESTTYHVNGFGLRYQLSALNAAIGLAQLGHFDKTAATRRSLWRTYRAALTDVPDATLIDVDIDRAVPHLCQILIPRQDKVFARLRTAHICAGVHYPPNHLQPAFAPWHRPLPATERTSAEILSLPFHPYLTKDDIAHVVRAVRDAVTTAPSGT